MSLSKRFVQTWGGGGGRAFPPLDFFYGLCFVFVFYNVCYILYFYLYSTYLYCYIFSVLASLR